MSYLGTKPANSPLTSELIPDGIITPADLSQGKPVWDANGNVGIGTNSPATKLHVSGTGDITSRTQTTNAGVYYELDTPATPSDYKTYWGTTNGVRKWGIGNYGTGNDNVLAFYIGTTERMRIDSSGNLLVGTTVTPSSSSSGCSIEDGAMRTSFGSYTGGGTHIYFINGNGTVGTINSSGTTTSYNTSSDYRLKENIAPMTDALDTVAQLKPVTYNWKVDGSSSQGFIAHELQAVVPDCVTGEKDAVDAEGKPVYQGIDTSFLVATLTAAIQEQQAIITDLKARIETLEKL